MTFNKEKKGKKSRFLDLSAMAEDPTEYFKSSLKEYFNADTFSDAVIQCGAREFKVHRLVLSAHSSIFSTMLAGDWKESDSGAIKLEEIEEGVAEAMVHFMYHFDYNNTQGASTALFDAQVYSLADKYMMPALKHLAKKRFESAVKTSWTLDDFPAAVCEVYSSTLESDIGLRGPVVETATLNIQDLMKKPFFLNLLKETPAFAADMLVAVSGTTTKQQSAEIRTYRCPSCSATFKSALTHNVYYYCLHCGSQRTGWPNFTT